jgi:hypothetical protein
MAKAMTLIGSVTLTSAQTSITFANIPQDYRDLKIVMNPIYSAANSDIGVQFNGTTGTTAVYMVGNGTTASSGTNTDLLGYTTSAGMLNEVHVMDYAQIDKHKSGVIRYGAAGTFAAAAAFRWASTSAVTSITFFVGSGTFSAGSTFMLYGVLG